MGAAPGCHGIVDSIRKAHSHMLLEHSGLRNQRQHRRDALVIFNTIGKDFRVWHLRLQHRIRMACNHMLLLHLDPYDQRQLRQEKLRVSSTLSGRASGPLQTWGATLAAAAGAVHCMLVLCPGSDNQRRRQGEKPWVSLMPLERASAPAQQAPPSGCHRFGTRPWPPRGSYTAC